MVRHTGTRHQPIIAHCPKYRIEGTALHNINRGSQERWERDIRTINEPLIDSGPQNLLSDALDIVLLHPLCIGYTLIEMGPLLSRTSSIPVTDLDR